MSCLTRAPQAVSPVTSRNDQINRVVISSQTNNSNFTVSNLLFF